MSTVIKTLHQENDIVIPRTKVNAVSDENGTGLNVLLDNKQETLVSGTNIKTINNQSILGSGNLPVGNVDDVKVNNVSVVTNKVANIDLTGKQDVLISENAGDNVTITSSASGHNLPSDYVELDYVEGTGSVFIRTGINFQVGTTVKVTFTPNNDLTYTNGTIWNYYSWVLGCGMYSNPKDTDKVRFRYSYNSAWFYDYVPRATRYVCETYLGDGIQTFTCNGKLISTQNVESYPQWIQDFTLFGNAQSLKGKIHEALLLDSSNVKLLHLIPARRLSDSAVGMYDLVSNVFFTRGEFIAGPEIENIVKIHALPGLTASVTELNYSDGVTSNIQTQLNNKSKVTVAETGTSTTKAKYITVDSNEYKLPDQEIVQTTLDDYLEHEAEYSLTNNIYFVEGTDLIDVSEEER